MKHKQHIYFFDVCCCCCLLIYWDRFSIKKCVKENIYNKTFKVFAVRKIENGKLHLTLSIILMCFFFFGVVWQTKHNFIACHNKLIFLIIFLFAKTEHNFVVNSTEWWNVHHTHTHTHSSGHKAPHNNNK